MNPSTVGPKFTWRGSIFHEGRHIYKKLNKALSNDAWSFEFPKTYVKVLIRVEFSNHHPTLISPKGNLISMTPRQFKFENTWILDDTYHNMVNDA